MAILRLCVLLSVPAFLFAQGLITPGGETLPNAPEQPVTSSSAHTSGVQAEHQIGEDGSAGSPSSVSNATAASNRASLETSSESIESSSKIEHSLFSSLFMAGQTQDKFKPLTAKKRLKLYADDLFSPFHFFMAGVSAGVTQAQNVPPEWGQGAEGFGRRYANYYATAALSNMLQMAGEDLLHEDNLYYGSGEHGIWRRVKYAVKSSVLARGSDGTRHFSVSQVGSTGAAAFISRLWQPKDDRSAGDGAVSFGIAMAGNAGVNVVREFLPDVTRHIFHRTANVASVQ